MGRGMGNIARIFGSRGAVLIGCAAVLLAANLLCPKPRQASGMPVSNGRADELAASFSPEWVLLAGSARYLRGVDSRRLSERTGRTVAAITAEHAGSAWLYLFLKNIAPERSVVVAPFRGAQLTLADLYADSGRSDLAYLMRGREAEVERLSYLGRMPEREYWLRRFLPLYAWREPAAKITDGLLAEESVYAPGAADPAQMQARERQAQQAGQAYDRRIWDFADQNQESYLALILEQARRKQIRLILVELPVGDETDPQIQTYQSALHAVLREAAVPVVAAAKADAEGLAPVLERELPALLNPVSSSPAP